MIEVNERTYRTGGAPVVGICLDGCDPAYLDAARAEMPNLRALAENGSAGTVETVVPSFTNPNNVAIVTGVPAAGNGICGNYYFDAANGREVPMDDPRFLTAGTILAAFAAAGRSVAAVTTKDKLRRMLGAGLDGVCFSVEKAADAAATDARVTAVLDRIETPPPDIYDPAASLFCIEAGLQLLELFPLDLLYLSTTDYVQHKYAPTEAGALDFYAELDGLIGRFARSGAVVGITADHGMNAKVRSDGSPNVSYLESELQGAGIRAPRVILPITDPYIVHHGALGSYATAYVEADQVGEAAAILAALPGIETVLEREEAAARFALPAARIGDLVVLADRDTVLGRTPDWHDLSTVASGLRSHGGLHEAVVPMLINEPLEPEYQQRLEAGANHNWDLFDLLLNGVAD